MRTAKMLFSMWHSVIFWAISMALVQRKEGLQNPGPSSALTLHNICRNVQEDKQDLQRQFIVT